MGFHVCTFCQQENSPAPATSSGDITLAFTNGHVYEVPDMILHYCVYHIYKPPDAFVEDVVSQELVSGSRQQSKSVPARVGYLESTCPLWFGDPAHRFLFLARLERMLREATKAGDRRQTRGAKPC